MPDILDMQGRADLCREILAGKHDSRLEEAIEKNNFRISVEDMRYKVAADVLPYYFVKNVLNYDKLIPNPHMEMTYRMRFPDSKRELRLYPRGIFKTTIFVIGGCLDLLRKDPDLNILIAMNSATNAQNVLSEIKAQITKNEVFQYLYGDWGAGAPRWKSDSVIINRAKSQRKEGSIDAVGMDTKITSRHYDVIFISDIVDENDRDSAAKRRDTRLFLQDIIDLRKDNNTPIWIEGTRWHFDDVYAYIIEEMNEQLAESGNEPFHVTERPAREGGSMSGKLMFPEMYDEKTLVDLMALKGIVSFSAQYLLKPLSDKSQIFKKENARYFDPERVDVDRCTRVCAHDPGLGEGKNACYTPIITGLRADYTDESASIREGDILVWDMDVDRRTPTENKVLMARKHLRWDYSFVGIEAVGFQKLFAQDSSVVHLDADTVVYLPVYPISQSGQGSKAARIEGLEPFYTSGRIKFRSDWRDAPNNYREGLSQLWNYPLDEYKDAPDCLEMLVRTFNMMNVSVA